MSILLAILLFGLIIFIHELGHFVVAKLSGITVLQFTIGFGPALVKKQVGETLYAIRIIPLGGAVMMLGEEDEQVEKVLTGDTAAQQAEPMQYKGIGYHEASLLKRFLVSIAGATMNYVSGIIIIAILLVPAGAVLSPVITDFMDGFEFEGQDGFMVGDEILSINDYTIHTYGDIDTAFYLYGSEPMSFTVLRDGEKVTLEQLPLERKLYDNEQTPKYGFVFGYEDVGALDKIGYAIDNSFSFVQSAIKGLGMLITGQVESDEMMGTVGIASELSSRAQQSATELWYFVAYISINLAVVNLLPIPALDGGKIIFIFIELLRGKKLNPKYEGYISLVGMVAILALFLFVTFNDIMRLVG